MYTILLYYKYVTVENPQALMLSQKALCEKLGLKGRIIVAREGINGTVDGPTEATEAYIEKMRDPNYFGGIFADIHFKKSEGIVDAHGAPISSFKRLSVKLRKEIVSLHLDEKDPEIGDVNPVHVTGKRLKPEDLHQWIREGREFTIVDMRNDYEHAAGHFKGSILPPLRNFRDLAQVLPDLEKKGLKKKTVLSVCTGGVRCEKASGYLVEHGFDDVYQLDGGIVSYMEKYPGEDFVGSLYVFDGRVTMHFNPKDKHVVVGRCVKCSNPSERFVNCSVPSCHSHFICCESCDSTCAKCLKSSLHFGAGVVA